MKIKNLLYLFVCLGFSILLGAGLYEHTVIWPKWSAEPPISFSMFEGEYGLLPTPFWVTVQPLVGTLGVIATVVFWKTPRRNYLLPSMILLVIVLIATFTYFAPTALSLLSQGQGLVFDPELKKAADTWETLSLFRILIMIPTTLYLYQGSSKSLSA